MYKSLYEEALQSLKQQENQSGKKEPRQNYENVNLSDCITRAKSYLETEDGVLELSSLEDAYAVCETMKQIHLSEKAQLGETFLKLTKRMEELEELYNRFQNDVSDDGGEQRRRSVSPPVLPVTVQFAQPEGAGNEKSQDYKEMTQAKQNSTKLVASQPQMFPREKAIGQSGAQRPATSSPATELPKPKVFTKTPQNTRQLPAKQNPVSRSLDRKGTS